LELARQIGQLVASTGDGTCTDGVLELDAFQQQQENDLLVHDIGMHAVRHGAHGAVVILRHVDAMSTRHFLQVLKSLQQHQKLMFVGITGIGTRSIHRHLKRYKHMRHIPKMQLDMDIRDELDEHLFSFANEPVETYLHAIAPFAPIGHAELQEILQLAIEKICRQEQGIRWKSLVITKELTEALVSPSNVEYLEWKDKTTGETVLVFSATGAHVLEEGSPIMNTITSQIQQCLTDVAPDRVG
jgi:CheY-like chemotaxis protein